MRAAVRADWPIPPVSDDRGSKGQRKTAARFVRDFPLGTIFPVQEFDQWAHDRGLLVMPSLRAQADKQSDGWKAHLMRRHETKAMLNRAGTHPAIERYGGTPFWIEPYSGSDTEEEDDRIRKWHVREPYETITNNQFLQRVLSLLGTKRKYVTWLIQSLGDKLDDPMVAVQVLYVYEALEDFASQLEHDVGRLEYRIKRLESNKRLLPKPQEPTEAEGE